MIQSLYSGAAAVVVAVSVTEQVSCRGGTVTSAEPIGTTAPGPCVVITHLNALYMIGQFNQQLRLAAISNEIRDGLAYVRVKFRLHAVLLDACASAQKRETSHHDDHAPTQRHCRPQN